MQSRPEHDRVASHHTVPAYQNQGDRDIGRGPDEEKDNEPDAVDDEATGGDEQTPKVGASVALKGDEAQDNNLNGDEECYARKRYQDELLWLGDEESLSDVNRLQPNIATSIALSFVPVFRKYAFKAKNVHIWDIHVEPLGSV
ncbi:conserved hypothetical protein [Aspergillus terreus NIH2624]|uniref:Uncharacterized protein n=1 Tax=Aspergillus terreus (strain NIH 2624 / FGSC A1156) TaxID=341663 RepID=Q0CDH3_ASPTN|nr:uncharacterized protein ATEG_08261 [Aspergillus terreus NIH2624]EAU31434.1 conserved hypothetical protein [Aspergillus terreus NIH2624]